MATIGFIGCGKTKTNHPAQAQFLYTGNLFVKSRAYAMAFFDRWYILSAKYELLAPTAVIAPYNVSLRGASPDFVKGWSAKTSVDIIDCSSTEDKLVFLAGQDYLRYLIPVLVRQGRTIKILCTGMSIGKREQWLNSQLALLPPKALDT
jgi:hypothetical protein